MLNALARGAVSKATDPVGRALMRTGLTPDAVTVIGTIGVVAASIGLLGTGHLDIAQVGYSAGVTTLVFLGGAFSFKKMERKFADVI